MIVSHAFPSAFACGPALLSPALGLAMCLALAAPLASYAADAASPAPAADAARIAALEARIVALEARLQRAVLTAEAQAARAPVAAAPIPTTPIATTPIPTTSIPMVDLAPRLAQVTASDWTERVQIRGDVRVRHDSLDATGDDARQRERFRARLSVMAKVDHEFEATFALASGNDDPISRNQTMDGGFTSKTINIEQAFIRWQPGALAGLEVLAGKYRFPLRVEGDAALVFDNDVHPEGLHVGYRRPVGDLSLFASGGAWWVDERSTSADAVLYGAQAGVRVPTGEASEIVLTLSSYHYANTDGRAPFYEATGRGNRLVGGRYATGYDIVDVGVDWKGNVGPAAATFFGDWVRNTAADRFDDGYAVGGTLSHHGITLSYAWKSLDADAVLGAFADSDFGLGGTDTRGHQASIGYELSRAVNLRALWASVERGGDAGATQDADRFLLDVMVRY